MSVNKLILDKENLTIDSESDYDVVTIDIDSGEDLEVANVEFQEFPGEDGEEHYIPNEGVVFKAYDWVVTLGVKATNAMSAIKRKKLFIDAIKGKEWNIKHEYTNLGACGCIFKKSKNKEVSKEYVIFECTFRVTKPSEEYKDLESVEYEEPVIGKVEYFPSFLDAEGGMRSIRTITYSQKKITTYRDGSTEEEIITKKGGEISFAFQASVDWATINAETGAITYEANTSGVKRNLLIGMTLIMNGKSKSKVVAQLIQEPMIISNPYFIGQTYGTKEDFKKLSASELRGLSTSYTLSTNSVSHEIAVHKDIFFIMLPQDVKFDKLSYESSGIVSELTLEEFNCEHADWFDTSILTAYKVYGYRAVASNMIYKLQLSMNNG